MKTIKYLDELKNILKITSDYQLANKLGLRPNSMSNYRHGVSFFNDETAIFVAKLLKLPAILVIANANYERAERQNKPDLAAIWRDLAMQTEAGLVGK
jgi:hypothetical protein